MMAFSGYCSGTPEDAITFFIVEAIELRYPKFVFEIFKFMTEEELFKSIDNGIECFKRADGYEKRIKVSKDPHSDWLIFSWRQLTWEENGIDYLIEVFPHIDEKENISSWTMYAAASYDFHRKRFNLKKTIADKASLEFIAGNIDQFLVSAYKLITGIPKNEIPFAVDLK